ncbi:MAG TPA: cold-shock protein [Planctomycetaceae bacterium]|nr:cold-shock protein [Planctomycetaceae bacterium]
MRVGRVVKVIPDKKIGFIRSADLNEDVFFHFSKVDKDEKNDLEEGDDVEYEVDELARIEKLRLQATLVRRSRRPLEVKIRGRDAPSFKAQHHPKARQRQPTWRGGSRRGPEENPDENE